MSCLLNCDSAASWAIACWFWAICCLLLGSSGENSANILDLAIVPGCGISKCLLLANDRLLVGSHNLSQCLGSHTSQPFGLDYHKRNFDLMDCDFPCHQTHPDNRKRAKSLVFS